MADEGHLPVLLREVCEFVRPVPGGVYLDCTVGAGGHAERLLALSQPDGRLIGLDRDRDALEFASRRLARFGERVILVHANFADAADVLAREGVGRVDGVIVDLGLSSLQLADAGRGFSFRHADAPLDMRADRTAGPTAAELLARLPEPELARILYEMADERFARRIARAVCRERQRRPIETVGHLVSIVERVVRMPRRRIHPATRTFLAMRYLTNSELPNLERVLAVAKNLVRPRGRVLVISYCGTEDRIVKAAFREQARDGVWRVLTRRPIVPTAEEVNDNPRARSAKMRVVERTESDGGG